MVFNKDEQLEIIRAKSILTKSVGDLLDELPKGLATSLKNNSILTGGSISSVMNGEKPNDYDLYLNQENDIRDFKQYIKIFQEPYDFIEDIDEKYTQVEIEGKLVTANATTFKNGIQVITMSTADARNNFDFVHCMPWFRLSSGVLFISKKQYDAIKSKTLIKNENYKLYLSQKRVEKYTSRGWRFKNGENYLTVT